MTLWLEKNFKYQPCTNISLANNFILCKSEDQFIKCIENQGSKIFDCYFREHTDPVMSPYYCAPVYFAIRRAYTEALIKLIELGQEIQNYPVDVDHPPLIPFACSIVRTQNCPSSGGLSTNEYRKQQMQILHLLLDNGADINALDSDNKSGLQHLLDNKGPRLFIGYEWSFAYMLLQRGAHINVRFHDGRRADQVLLKYLNSSKYMEFCRLSPRERQEIVDKIYESNHQYAFSELVEIAARIKEAVKKVVSLEEELYFHPEHFRENSSYHHSLNGSLAFLESRKKQILKDMKRLGEALNYCGKEIRPVSNSTKNVLSLSITLITRKLVKENIRTYLPNITIKCQKEIYSILDEITFRKDSLPFFQNLIPSDFFGGCVLKTKSPFYKQEVLPNEAQYTLDSLQNYFKYQNNHFLNLIQKKILQFMDDQCPLEDLMITSTNARQYLIEVKLIDIALAAFIKSSSPKINFQNSTYPIRTRILEVASPFMTTCEAYTKTLDSRKIKIEVT